MVRDNLVSRKLFEWRLECYGSCRGIGIMLTPSPILGRGSIGGGPVEEVVFDPSAAWAHSEFEFGIMGMFGGFGGSLNKEYWKYKPKDEPVEEWEDRVQLYEL
jgi:hypothetical protein